MTNLYSLGSKSVKVAAKSYDCDGELPLLTHLISRTKQQHNQQAAAKRSPYSSSPFPFTFSAQISNDLIPNSSFSKRGGWFSSVIVAPMASSAHPLLLFFLIAAAASTAASSRFGLDLHHRFSDKVRRWAESRSHRFPGGWPEKGTADYFRALAGHDHGRLLAASSSDQELAFADGNETIRINNLGFLHYALVDLGTPNVTFLVALDTGSDLFWVPCDCTSCAPTKSGTNGFDFDFNVYSPNMSSTSQAVPCNSSFCGQGKCSGDGSHCPYNVEYVSADTSSSGYLIEDLLYLSTEDTNPKVVKVSIVFGCGQIQTGSFLDAAAPNGLFGLGMEKVSVPSTLSSSSITSNSFSMCFGRDGLGRISFGDNGSSDQEETPFNVKHSHTIYNISITGVGVGNSSMNVDFSALVDSGTSFTYLADPAYTSLSTSFNAQVHDKPYIADSSIPFENCYHISSNETLVKLPNISFTTKGGSQFPINDPIILIENERQRQYIYCLAVIKSNHISIIGQNFLTGLRVVFDRERMVLGWKKFNCYEAENSNPLPVNPQNSSAPPPSIAFGPRTYTPEATKEKGNGTVTVLSPGAASSHSSLMNSVACTILMLLLLPLSILS